MNLGFKKKVVVVISESKKEDFKIFFNNLSKLFDIHFLTSNEKVEKESIYLLMGGDGTLNYFVNHIEASNDIIPKVMYLPQGTANDFAKALKLDVIEPSVKIFNEIIEHNKFMTVTRRKCNEKFFINVATVGNPAQTTESKGGPFKRFFGKISYYLKGVEKLASQDIYEVEIIEPIYKKFKTLGFVVSQGAFAGGGIKVSTRFTPNFNPPLEFLAFDTVDVIPTSRGVLEIQKDNPILSEIPIVNEFSTYFKMTCKPEMPVKLDGEEYMASTFLFTNDELKLDFYLY